MLRFALIIAIGIWVLSGLIKLVGWQLNERKTSLYFLPSFFFVGNTGDRISIQKKKASSLQMEQ